MWFKSLICFMMQLPIVPLIHCLWCYLSECSYANLITLAINSSKTKKMTLNEIYNWICENFPYYQEIGTGWKVCLVL